MEKFNWNYSEYSDILHVHKKDESTKGSVELGDFTLDFGKNNEVVGVEIEHASDFFNSVDIDKGSLNNIKDIQLIINKRNPQCQLIFLRLELPVGVKKVALPMPIVA